MKRYFFSFLTLSLLSLSSTAMAKITPLAFKGVTQSLRKGKEIYSPTLGEEALDSLISNIRFNGNFKAHYDASGARIYSSDSSKDPLWNLTKTLFPSTNGVLGAVTRADSNIGRSVHDPETVAILINFAHQIRKVFDKNPEESVKGIKKNTLASLKPKLVDDKNKKNINTTINNLLKYIEESIRQEIKDGAHSLYPKGTTEQVILGFFCYKFDTQDDIWRLLKAYDADITDEAKLSLSHSLLTRADVESLTHKPVAQPYGLDDVFDLANGDIFTSILPYKADVPLLNNGLAELYSRGSNTPSKEAFADCVETSIRHILNLTFFDPEKRLFDTSHIAKSL